MPTAKLFDLGGRVAVPVIGWIGAGRMGVPLAGFILKAGYPLVVCSRNEANGERLVAQGATAAATPADCAKAADIVFASLPDDDALRKVALGADGVLAHARRGAIFVETSTVSAEVSAEVDREASRLGIAYLRMPISGNAASAQHGDVSVFVSGPEPAWGKAKPVVQTFSKAQSYVGGAEQARYIYSWLLGQARPAKPKPPLSANATPEVSSIQNLMTLKKRSGLSLAKTVSRVPGGKASPKATGRIRVILRPNVSGYQYVVGRIDVPSLVRVGAAVVWDLGPDANPLKRRASVSTSPPVR
jgi:NAD binding domain of 6-phosphogluconate dehydrogenase